MIELRSVSPEFCTTAVLISVATVTNPSLLCFTLEFKVASKLIYVALPTYLIAMLAMMTMQPIQKQIFCLLCGSIIKKTRRTS